MPNVQQVNWILYLSTVGLRVWVQSGCSLQYKVDNYSTGVHLPTSSSLCLHCGNFFLSSRRSHCVVRRLMKGAMASPSLSLQHIEDLTHCSAIPSLHLWSAFRSSEGNWGGTFTRKIKQLYLFIKSPLCKYRFQELPDSLDEANFLLYFMLLFPLVTFDWYKRLS